jgi:hypothetical protein
MRALLIAPFYIHWHYGRALCGIKDITGNLIWFIWHFFSIGILFETLFSPWQRIKEEHKRGLDIENYLSTLLVNMVMRLVGIFIRFIFICIGLVCVMSVFIAGIIVFALWLALPLVVALGIIMSFVLMFKAV